MLSSLRGRYPRLIVGITMKPICNSLPRCRAPVKVVLNARCLGLSEPVAALLVLAASAIQISATISDLSAHKLLVGLAGRERQGGQDENEDLWHYVAPSLAVST